MALHLGKLAILVGAGIAGSILAKEGRMSGVSDFVSSALKFAFRQLKHDDSTPSVKKPCNDHLKDQVDSLREELQQLLQNNNPVLIVTGCGTGTRKYSIIIVVVVVGYGYLWWKGWKLPDMMFATRRSLSDARDAIAKQLDSVYSSISATKRHLSKRIEGVDNHLNEIVDITDTTQREVNVLQNKSKALNSDVQSFRDKVQDLESKINRIEGKQDITNEGVSWLLGVAGTMEKNKSTDCIQASSRPSIEAPKNIPSRTGSSPPIISVELPSPSDSNGTHKVKRSPRSAVSAAGLKDVGESSIYSGTNGNGTSEDKSSGFSSCGVFRMYRTQSLTNAVPQWMRSSRQQSE